MAQEKKVVPFFKTLTVTLDASGVGVASITADNNREITIEQFTADVRVTATKALTDNEVLVDVKDTVNSSYTGGQVPVTHLAGKASQGFPRYLPATLKIARSTKMTFEFEDVSAVANTVRITAIGTETVLG